MSFIEFLGFIIAMISMIFLFVRKVREDRRRRLHPEEFAHEHEEEDRAVKELLDSLNVRLEEPKKSKLAQTKLKRANPPEKQISTPPLKPVQQLNLSYHAIPKDTISRAQRLIRQGGTPKNFIIYHEILGPPKGLQ